MDSRVHSIRGTNYGWAGYEISDCKQSRRKAPSTKTLRFFRFHVAVFRHRLSPRGRMAGRDRAARSVARAMYGDVAIGTVL